MRFLNVLGGIRSSHRLTQESQNELGVVIHTQNRGGGEIRSMLKGFAESISKMHCPPPESWAFNTALLKRAFKFFFSFVFRGSVESTQKVLESIGNLITFPQLP